MWKSSSQFDRCLEKATSHLLLEPDWGATLEICDVIRQGDVQPKTALSAMRKKIVNDNPHVASYALQVLESVVKNCGSLIQSEIATKEFMEFMKEQAKARDDPVKAKVLELIQVWSHAFRNIPSYRAVQDMYHLMKAEDFKFPVLKESDAMFSAEKAPEWKEGDCCHRCRVSFGVLQRRHHCRNCGQIFCGKCSSKSSIIPKFGIEKEVRVCDSCHETLVKPTSAQTNKKSDDDLPSEYLTSSLAQQPQVKKQGKSEDELREEEELQLALALSQSEAESKAKEQRDRSLRAYTTSSRNDTSSSTDSSSSSTSVPPVIDTSDMDPELARYLNRNYWEKKKDKSDNAPAGVAAVSTTAPSAPVAQTEPKHSVNKMQEVYQNGDDSSQDQFLSALRSSVEIFVNRMKSNSMRGRSIANDSSVQTLFLTINQMHPELTKYLQEQEDLRAHYEGLQDKLAQLKDAREALDALRADHMEKRRREAEEAERQRQIQMFQKLEVMRQKKQEYLEYQGMLAQQRLAEQEREIQQRLEQQKHLAQMRHMQQYAFPQAQMYGSQLGQPNTFSPGGSAEGSPIHRLQQPGPMYAQGMQNMPGMMPQQGMPPPQNMGYQYQPVPGQQFPGQVPNPNSMPNTGQSSMAGQAGVPTQGGQYWSGQGVQVPQSGYQPVYNQTAPQGVPGGYTSQNQGAGEYGAPPQDQYQSFDMQAMAGALPNMPMGQQPPPPNMPQHGQHQYSQMPYQGPGHPHQYSTHDPQQQHQQQGQDQLISFD